jgi:hypothetical protein
MHSSRPIFVANLAAIIAMFTVGIWFIRQWGVYGTMAGQALNALIVATIHFLAWRAIRQDALSQIPTEPSPTAGPDNG